MKVRSISGIVAFLLLATTLSAQVLVTNVVPPLGGHGETVFIKIYGGGFLPGGHPPASLSVKFNQTLSTAGPSAVVADNEIDISDVPAAATSGFIGVSINGGAFKLSPQPFIIVPTNMPYATNFSPTYENGADVIITGVHFQTANLTNVTFNGVRSASYFKNSDNKITVSVPAGAATGPFILQSQLGVTHNLSTLTNVITTATNFFIQPVITSFSPASGRAGTNVVLTGTNFFGISGITFGTVPATDLTISNNGTIRVTVPVGVSTGKISISPPNGTALSTETSTNDFKILPSIDSFSPNIGPTNTVITVLGSGLNEKSPHPDVTVGGGAAVTFGTISPGTLSFNVPANATSGPITVTTTNGSVTSSQVFYLPAAITNIAPTNGGIGTLVHISGNNFTNASAVAFNGITTSFVVTNNNHIGAVAPLGVTSGTISVATPFGMTNSAGLFYIAPTITDFTPTHGIPGTRVTINGTSFTNATAVAFNGTPAASFIVTNNGTLSAVVPDNVTSGKITVTAPGGTGQSATDFTLDTADLSIKVSDAPDPVFVGSNLVYSIVVTNAGPATALNVRFTNTLSQSVMLKSATISQGTLTTNSFPIVGSLGDMANQSSATISLTVTPLFSGMITNVASVGSDSIDQNTANNTATTATTVLPFPFLSITNLMSNDLVKISWPAPLSNFTLQFAGDLTNTWTNDTTPRTVSGTNISVIETTIGTARFYRLTN